MQSGNPAIKISAGNRSIVLTDTEVELTEKWQENINSEEFMAEILRAKKIQKMYEIADLGWPKDFAEDAVKIIFDKQQAENEENGILDGLSDMAINLCSYYKYIEHGEETIENSQSTETSFLEKWKVLMNSLIQDGLIKNEEINQGVEIPHEWLNSSLINSNIILMAMRNVYKKKFTKDIYSLEDFKKHATIKYIIIERKSSYRNFCR